MFAVVFAWTLVTVWFYIYAYALYDNAAGISVTIPPWSYSSSAERWSSANRGICPGMCATYINSGRIKHFPPTKGKPKKPRLTMPIYEGKVGYSGDMLGFLTTRVFALQEKLYSIGPVRLH